MSGAAGRWADLSRRVISAAVLLAIGAVLAVAEGIWLRLGMGAIIGVTFWELARLTGWRHPEMHGTLFGKHRPVVLGVVAGLSLYAALNIWDWWGGVFLFVPLLLGLPGALKSDQWVYTVFGLAILLVGYGLVGFREVYGLPFVLWLMGIVIASDILGISPEK